MQRAANAHGVRYRRGFYGINGQTLASEESYPSTVQHSRRRDVQYRETLRNGSAFYDCKQ